MRRSQKGMTIHDDVAPLTAAEIHGFKHQINSVLLRRFIVTIDELHRQIDERDRQIQQFSQRGEHHAHH